MLGRGAVRLATQHAIKPGNVAVILGGTHEVPEHIAALRAVGTEVAAVIAPRRRRRAGPSCRAGVRPIVGEIVQAHGKKRVKAVSVRYTGGTEKIDVRPAVPLRQPDAAGEPAAPGHGDARARGRRPARPGAASTSPSPTRARSARGLRAARAPSCPSSARRRGAAATAAMSASARTSRCRTCATP